MGRARWRRARPASWPERIRESRAGNDVEATPERTTTRKVVRAEWPVTARIRERLGEVEPRADEAELEPVAAPVVEVITMPVKPGEEVPVDDKPDVISGIVVPAMYQERGHAGRVAWHGDGGLQLRLF